jgi:hypothetical protein
MLGLIGMENRGIRTGRGLDRGGQHEPPMLRFRLGEDLALALEAIARRGRGGSGCAGRPRRVRRVGRVAATRPSRRG